MIRAIEAKGLTEVAVEKEISTRAERAKELCDTTINKLIEERANERGREITVKEIDRKLYYYVVDYLKDNGYIVTQLNGETLQVIW